jgi:hypothetical protein
VHQHKLQVELTTSKEQRFSGSDLLNLGVILLLCCVFAYVRWLKLDTLVWGDPALWLDQGQRLAAGELPYRDFWWSYPPLTILLLGGTMKLFGVTFLIAQLFVDAASLVVVLLSYFLLRLILPRFLLLPAIICFISMGGTSLMFFSLFSFNTYIPALQIGAAGFLLLLIGVLSYLRTGKLSRATLVAMALGSFIAIYTKPETVIASFCTLGLLAAADRHYWFAERSTSAWFRQYAKMTAVCVIPVLIAYVLMGALAGFGKMVLGITGYGLARAACPFWPTGLGLFGAAASLGEAAFIASLLSLTRRRKFLARFGPGYYYFLICGFAGLCVYIAYVIYLNWPVFAGPGTLTEKVFYSSPSTVWSSAVLLPVMWSCVALWLWRLFGFVRSGRSPSSAASLNQLLLLTGPVAMSSRGWFNWHLGTITNVPAICYPFFILLAPYLIWRFLNLAGPGPDLDRGVRALAGATVVTLFLAYAGLRIAGDYTSSFSRQANYDLSTLAGDIRLTDSGDSEIYRFVIENSGPGDGLLDIPYGGGMNVATHRLSPLFSGQFEQLKMPDELLQKDLDQIRSRPPKIVIVQEAPNYGVFYGLNGCTCAFPHLVWVPAASTIEEGKDFPAIDYIRQNYRVAKSVGSKLLLVPK